MITVTSGGSFKHVESFLRTMSKLDVMTVLKSWGQTGVNALAAATPVRTGLVASSWSYEVVHERGVYSLIWNNSDVESGFPVAIMLQYGYGTGTGGYVQGQDYINPALKPVFDKIAKEVWKAVTSA